MNKDNKKFVTESLFIKEALKAKLSLPEFLLLLYFDNAYEAEFDIKLIAKVLGMNENLVLESYSNLMKKKLIKVVAEKNGYGKITEKVSLDNFYKDVALDERDSNKDNEKKDIYSMFESEFGRTLSGIDYEIINAWIDKGFSEELIIAALKEAVYNGVKNLRYIDKILYEWNRKGIKSPKDVNKNEEDNDLGVSFETSVLNFNWLNEK